MTVMSDSRPMHSHFPHNVIQYFGCLQMPSEICISSLTSVHNISIIASHVCNEIIWIGSLWLHMRYSVSQQPTFSVSAINGTYFICIVIMITWG
jgi:hypothetical protein